MRQETLFRGLVDGFVTLGWVPWGLTCDTRKTVTSGREAQDQPIWTPALLPLAAEFGVHPEAGTPGAGHQKGSVASLVKWGKRNFLAGRACAADAALAQPCRAWLESATPRPSQATEVPPVGRLAGEAATGGALPASARAGDDGGLPPGRVSAAALVAVLGSQDAEPMVHVGAPVTVRVHRERGVLWRDTIQLGEHPRAPDGAHQRVMEPQHSSRLFAKQPRAGAARRGALVQLGPSARWYASEVCRWRRAPLPGREVPPPGAPRRLIRICGAEPGEPAPRLMPPSATRRPATAPTAAGAGQGSTP
jgi:hypothetical protein